MKRWYTSLALIGAGAGIFYYLLHQHIIVIAFSSPSYTQTQASIQASKKRSPLFFYKNDSWCQEATDLVWPHDPHEALSYLCNRWLAVAAEEELLHKKVTVTHAFISPDKKGYISFDQSPFEPYEQSIHQKIVVIEGLTRSVQASGLEIDGLYYMVNDKPLSDYHLDFALAWPIKK